MVNKEDFNVPRIMKGRNEEESKRAIDLRAGE